MCGLLGYQFLFDLRLSRIEEQMQGESTLFIAKLSQRLGAHIDVTKLLYADLARRNQNRSLPIEANSPMMVELFREFLTANSNMYQLRWLDDNGQERIKLIKHNKQILVIPEDKLVDKGHRDYFQAAKDIGLGNVYLSQINLNVEYGQVELPFRITVRTIMRTEFDGMQPGYLVANFQLNSLLDTFRHGASEQFQLFVADATGNWLLHPEPTKEWGNQLNHPEYNISNAYTELWQTIQSGERIGSVNTNGRLWRYMSLETELNNIAGAYEKTFSL
ncbi:hypothetical protein ACFQMB_05575 [Pseudobowmanella zhangzhouensis]|uniref:hypothetical protein n=1 Tax=Pseudobowmanella zhangzhouensis TaxID=1537679 RepID=UPI0036141B4D